MTPPAKFLFHTVKVVDLALRKRLSDEQLLQGLRKIHDLQKRFARDTTKHFQTNGQQT